MHQYETQKNYKILHGTIDHEAPSMFGDSCGLLGLQREECLVAETDCVFLTLKMDSIKNCTFFLDKNRCVYKRI